MADPPRLIYDDDCGFCTWWVEYVVERGRFEPVGFSELTDADLAHLPENYERCAHLLADGRRYSCGAAIEEAMARTDAPISYPTAAFRLLPGRRFVREPLYRLAAENRPLLGRIARREPPAGDAAE